MLRNQQRTFKIREALCQLQRITGFPYQAIVNKWATLQWDYEDWWWSKTQCADKWLTQGDVGLERTGNHRNRKEDAGSCKGREIRGGRGSEICCFE